MRKRSFAEPGGKRRGSYGILKAFVMVIAGMTLLLGARELASLRPLDRYIDEGAVSFIPVDVVSDTRHYVRPHRWVRGFWTTEYWVVYESRGPRRYEWRDYVGDDGDRAYRELSAGGALKKRVLTMTDGGYLVVEPDETPERYVYNKLRAIGVSALICVSLIAWCIVPWMRKNCFGPDAPTWTWDLVKQRTSCWIMGIGCFITVSTVLGGWQVYVDVVMLLLGSDDLALRNSVEGMAWVLLPIGIGLVLLGKYWQGKSETGEHESSPGPMS